MDNIYSSLKIEVKYLLILRDMVELDKVLDFLTNNLYIKISKKKKGNCI